MTAPSTLHVVLADEGLPVSPADDRALYPLSVEQYHQMARVGILTADDAVELLEGWLVQKMTKSPRHRIAVRLLFEALLRATPPGWYADSQEPITLADSELEPDAVIVRGRTVDYASRHPGAQDVALVVEVAEASLLGPSAEKAHLCPRRHPRVLAGEPGGQCGRSLHPVALPPAPRFRLPPTRSLRAGRPIAACN